MGLLLLAALPAALSGCAGEEGDEGPGWQEIGLWAEDSGLSPAPDAVLESRTPVPPALACLGGAEPPPAAVFFSKPCSPAGACTCEGVDLSSVVAHFVQSATADTDLCVMELQDFKISNAVIAAHQAGRPVRLVLDDGYADPDDKPAIGDLVAAGVQPKSDAPHADKIMHHKFAVLDDAMVLVSSGNFSTFDALSNANNLLLFESPELALLFRQRFDAMWFNGVFHADTGAGPHAVQVGGYPVEVLFGPSWAMIDRLVAAIQNAKEAIHFSIFAFTLEQVKEALLARCGEVEILGVYDTHQADDPNSVAPWGWCGGAEIRSSAVPGDGFGFNKLHHKLMIIDPAQPASGLVVTGSANWSYSAATKNDESMLVLHDPALVREFESEFQARFSEAAGRAR